MTLIASSMPISLTSHELCLDAGTYNEYFSSNHIKFYKMWAAQEANIHSFLGIKNELQTLGVSQF